MTVEGISMYPTLKKGDQVLVVGSKTYNVGEIIVYTFEDRGILIHRILRLEGNKLFCKGDNAYRLEQISEKNIIGKVTAVNGLPIQKWPFWKTQLSYKINRIYYTSNFDVQYTKSSETYKLFEFLVLEKKQDFRVEFISDVSHYKLFNENTNNSYMHKIFFEVLEMIKCNMCYSEMVSLISAKHSIDKCKSKEIVNCILSKLVINHLVSIRS